MPISEFDRRIELNKYIFGQTDYGGNIKALVSSYDIWARLRSLNGSKYLENLQVTYSKAFEITTRYESTRQLTETDEIVYEDFVYLIQSIAKESEGKKKYNKIIAYTTGTTSNTGEVIYRVSNIIHFTGTGTEYSLQDNRLIGWESLLVFRDGIEYRITVNAPLNKEVRYDKNTGELFFSTDILPLQNGEAVDAYLITKSSTATLTGGTIDTSNIITNEVPSGAVNGSNAIFTTEFDFVPESVAITLNGLEEKNFTTSGTSTIIFQDSPQVGDSILIDYIKA